MNAHATLLPEARIDAFVGDPQTAQTLQKLSLDWRFSRVRLNVVTGDINTAVNRYTQEKSPDLLIIETTSIDDSFTGNLEALANVCATGTAAVFIGPENDITLYRRLLEMGATDYLVNPLKIEDVVSVVSKTLLDRLGSSQSRVTTFMGAKGGVGTSRIAQIFCHALAKVEEPATLFDCGGSWSLLGATYGREPMITMRDLATLVRTTPDALDDIIQKVAPHLSFVNAGGDPLLTSTMTSDGFEGVIDVLCRKNPHVVIDLSQSSTGIRAMAFAKSHDIVLVTNATPIALRNTRNLIREIHQMRGQEGPLHLVVNETGLMPKEELSTKDIHEALGIAPAISMPFLSDIFSKLDTADPEPAGRILGELTPYMAPLVYTVTGKRGVGAPVATPRADLLPESAVSLLNRLWKKG
jgi:pilus assembly protein CpaE